MARSAVPSPATDIPVASRAPDTLVLFDRQSCDESWLATLTSLQGLVARHGGKRQIYLTQSGTGHALWPKELASVHGVRLESASRPEDVLASFAREARGYVLFDRRHRDSVNAATILASTLDAVLVDRTHEAAAVEAGLACLGNGLAVTSAELVRREREHLNADVLAEQSGERTWGLRDYLILGRVPVLFDGDFAALADGHDRAIFGWGNAERGEREFIARNSRLGLFTIPSDHALNLSVLSAFRPDRPLHQRKTPAAIAAGEKVHLVTFVLTDGDNAGWVLGDFAANPRWFGSPSRGRVPMGFGLPPSLVRLAPDALAWFYRQAAEGAGGGDGFVAGPSGGGYFFPSLYPPGALAEHVHRLADWMRQADLRIVEVLDEDALERTDVWSAYLRDPQIDGLIYLDYAPYNKGHGRIVWAAGKPVVSARSLLWRGLQGADAVTLIHELNAAPRDPRSAAAYTLVSVHAWSHTVADVESVAGRLDSAVRVVTPDVFFATLRANLHPDSP